MPITPTVPTLSPTVPVTDYRFFIATLLNGVIKEELPLVSVSFSSTINATGSFSGQIDLDNAKATFSNLSVNETALYVERNGALLWGGILTTVSVSLNDRTVTLGAQGFWGYFKQRYVHENRIYAGWDQIDIVKDLVLFAQGTGSTAVGTTGIPASPGVPGIPGQPSTAGYASGSIGVILDSPIGAQVSGVIPSALAEDPNSSDAVFAGNALKNIGDSIETMSKEDSPDPTHVRGFDFGIFPKYATDGTIQKIFRVGYPTLGYDTGLILQTGALILDLSYDVDGKKQANVVYAIGKGSGQDDTPVAIAGDPVTPDVNHDFPLMEGLAHFKTVQDLNVLQALADGSVAAFLNPIATIKATVRITDDFPLFVPGGAETFLGDFLTLDVQEGWLQVTDKLRVVEWEITVGDAGEETLVLTLSKTYSVQFS